MLSKEPGSVCPSLSGGPSTKCRMHSGQLWPLEVLTGGGDSLGCILSCCFFFFPFPFPFHLGGRLVDRGPRFSVRTQCSYARC